MNRSVSSPTNSLECSCGAQKEKTNKKTNRIVVHVVTNTSRAVTKKMAKSFLGL